MGNTQRMDQQQQTTSQLMKRKNSIVFRQDDFIREIEGSIEMYYEIMTPSIKQNQFFQLRKVIHRKTNIIRSAYVINKYKVRSNERELIQKQIHKLKSVDHPYLNKIYQLFKDNHKFYIVTQLCVGDSLAALLEQEKIFDESKAATIMWQLLGLINHCNRKDILHGDLKFENIRFISKKQEAIKVVDYSISRIFRVEEIIEQNKGKVCLIAPETLNSKLGDKSDIWSCGMILYCLLCGEGPIIGSDRKKLERKINSFKPQFKEKIFKFVSKEAKELITGMLRTSPDDRVSIQDCLRYPWFKKYYRPPGVTLPNLTRSLMQCYNFNPSSKLQQAAWAFFVNALVTFEEKKSLLTVFIKLDRGCRGELSEGDLYEGFREFYTERKSQFFSRFIMKKNNYKPMKFSQFLTLSTNRTFLITESNTHKIFQIFDDDGSGEISVSELKETLGSSKEVTEDIWLELMKEADSNSDGMISLLEFKAMMKELQNKRNEEILLEGEHF